MRRGVHKVKEKSTPKEKSEGGGGAIAPSPSPSLPTAPGLWPWSICILLELLEIVLVDALLIFHIDVFTSLSRHFDNPLDWDDHDGVRTCISSLPQFWKISKPFSSVFLMAEVSGCSKHKDRGSNNSEDRICSPEGKKICGQDVEESELNSGSDAVLGAVEMSERIAQQLELISKRLGGVESKLEGILQKVESLERSKVGVKSDVVALQSKTKTMENTMHQMESGLSFSEVEMTKLKKCNEENQQEIKELEDRLLYKEVYDRRENSRFLGIPEEADENTSEVLYQFVADKLNIEGAREIEFQCIHRIGNKRSGSIRPIIARFLRFPDRERIFRKAMELKDGLDV